MFFIQNPRRGCPRQGCPWVALLLAHPATAHQDCLPPALARPRRGGRAQDARPQHRRSCQKKKTGLGRRPELSAWHSPFGHMNELGSGIGLEGVLNTVWVKQIVPLSVDPGKRRLKQQQQSTRAPLPFLEATLAVRSPCAPAIAPARVSPPAQNCPDRLVSFAVAPPELAPGRVGCPRRLPPPGPAPPGLPARFAPPALPHLAGDRVAPARVVRQGYPRVTRQPTRLVLDRVGWPHRLPAKFATARVAPARVAPARVAPARVAPPALPRQGCQRQICPMTGLPLPARVARQGYPRQGCTRQGCPARVTPPKKNPKN